MPLSQFSDHASEITVPESTFHYAGAAGCAGTLSTLGTLRNTGSNSWKHLQIEVLYFNSKGERIDSLTDTPYDLEVGAGQEVTFRVTGNPSRTESEYATQKVLIRNAKDADAFF
jgi:hypothetical protein